MYSQDFRASMWFLEESEVYATVKPYSLSFTPEAPIPRQNIERKEVSVLISDLRGSEQLFSVDRNGFMVLEFQDQYQEADWDDETSVRAVHYPKIVSEVERAIPEARCIALYHQVCSHHCGLPYLLTKTST